MWIVLLAVAAAAAYWCVSTLLEVRRQAEGRTEEAGESTPAPVDLSPLAAVLDPAVRRLLCQFRTRGETIGQLAAALTSRRADLQAVYLAGDILLTQRPVGKTG